MPEGKLDRHLLVRISQASLTEAQHPSLVMEAPKISVNQEQIFVAVTFLLLSSRARDRIHFVSAGNIIRFVHLVQPTTATELL